MRRMKMILVMCLAAGLSGAASAATWTGLGGNSNWSNADNWDTGVVPGQHEPVNIDGSAAVNFDSGNIERSANTNLTGSAKLTAANRRFLHGANAACTFTIADEAQLVHSGDYFIVSQRQPSTINQTGGTVTATINRGFFMTDNGSAAGSRYNLTGGALNVQFVAQGDDWFNEFLGRGGAQGTFYVDGGQANISVNPAALTRHIYIKNGSVLQVDSGSASFSGFRWFSIGRSDSGEAKVIVNGGVLNITSRSDGAVIVGGENSEGRIEVSGGRLNIAGPNGLWIADGAGSKRGIVEQTGGDITVDSDVVLGRAGTAEGTYYKMDGGTLTARDLYLGENAHASVQFIFNAGVITLGGDRTSLVEEAWFHAAPGTLVEYDSVNDVTVISLIPHAHNPLPAHGAVDVPVDVTLSWKTGLSVDPNDNPGQPNATISKHLLYMSSGNAGDTSLYFIAEIPAGDPVGATGSYGPLSLDLDKTYAWRVDEVAEPNIFTGPVWSFSTPHATPVQVGISPAKSLVDTGTPIAITNTYTSIASSVTGVTWYLNDVAIDPQTDSNISVVFNATQSTLSIASVSDAYTGQYTCVVRNEGGDSAPSAPAAVALKKLLAWYPFEQNAVDAAGHNSGTLMGGELAYASGSVASGGQAYAADPNGSNYLVLTADSYPKAGFGNGLDSFTVSFWLLEGSNTGDDIYVLGSLNDGNRTGFEFGVNSGGNLKCHYRDEDGNGSLTQSGGLSLRDGQWHYLVVTRSGDTLTVYADGEAKASSSVGAIDNFAAWDHPFTILADNLRGTITKHVTGMVDDLRIYNYGLTSEEIAVAYYDETGTSACLDAPDTRYNLVNTGSSYCRVDLTDFAEFALNWLDCGLYPDCL
jgi:hypothetical protein